MHVEAWLQRAAASAPDTTAVEASGRAVSYAQLLVAARAGEQELRARGAGPGERVAIALPPGLAFAQALHACMLLGAPAVPVDLRLTESERERISAGAAVTVTEPLCDLAGPVESPTGPVESPVRPVESPTGPIESAAHDLDAVAVVIHTSGTTSAPRPIELTYGNLLWSALGSGVALGVDSGERWLCALPLSHVGGLSILVRSAIYCTTAVVHERFDTERALTALMDDGITLVSLVSTTLARLLDAGLREPPALRCALTGGGPVPHALVRRAREAGVPVCETYGLTECCSQAATAPVGSAQLGAGVPLFCTSVEIERAGRGADEGRGGAGLDDGEIVLSGPTVAPGALAHDGRLHTGDLGRIDEHGFLRVTGRMADTIVTGGENVAPAEVEAVLESHPGVSEAAVIGREDPQWGEAVTAIVVVDSGVSVDEQALRDHCSASLAPYKVPKRFALASSPLPRTASGKLLRRELR